MAQGERPVELHSVEGLAEVIGHVLTSIRAQLGDVVPGVAVEHIGATSLGHGLTKGDVDVNLRVRPEDMHGVVEALREHFEVAQPEKWTATYASFSAHGHELPVGIQVCVKRSVDDFLVTLRDRFRTDEDLRRQYDEVKRRAAPLGAEAYWQAKDAFLRPLVGRR